MPDFGGESTWDSIELSLVEILEGFNFFHAIKVVNFGMYRGPSISVALKLLTQFINSSGSC
jgi:hypothetical protein